jgi:hypothetical protein
MNKEEQTKEVLASIMGINFVESTDFHTPFLPSARRYAEESALIFPRREGQRVIGVKWARTFAGDSVVLEAIYEPEVNLPLDSLLNLGNQPLMGPGRPVGWVEQG